MTVRKHCALLAIHTGLADINAARDIGRPSVRALLGLIRRDFPVLDPADVLWEGAIVSRRKGRLGFTVAESSIEVAEPADKLRLSTVGLALAAVSLLQMKPHLRRSLGFLAFARSAEIRIEKFMHLWLAAVALASYRRPAGDRDLTRISDYVDGMGTGQHGVLSQARITQLKAVFSRANNARNRALHRNDESFMTLTLLEELEKAVFELVDFELARGGTPIVQ